MAREHRAGRRLFVGTTNLDSRRFTVWDMGQIASSDDPGRYEHYRKVIRASASMPVAFEPVYFDFKTSEGRFSQMHVDGGAMTPLFLQSWMLKQHKAEGFVNGDVYVILNLPIGEAIYEPVSPDLPAIAFATLRAYSDSLNARALEVAYALAKEHEYRCRYIGVPTTMAESVNPLEFNQAFLSMLYKEGRALAQTNDPWQVADL